MPARTKNRIPFFTHSSSPGRRATILTCAPASPIHLNEACNLSTCSPSSRKTTSTDRMQSMPPSEAHSGSGSHLDVTARTRALSSNDKP
ncbi:hypothetical protein WG66_001378 [Moniliophthora roreri]|nr:hypothetical protein WG66_001378 [Moniliophthora roreri]